MVKGKELEFERLVDRYAEPTFRLLPPGNFPYYIVRQMFSEFAAELMHLMVEADPAHEHSHDLHRWADDGGPVHD